LPQLSGEKIAILLGSVTALRIVINLVVKRDIKNDKRFSAEKNDPSLNFQNKDHKDR
jgi:hypothetical protein